eukprot:tig00001056_g6643.t1
MANAGAGGPQLEALPDAVLALALQHVEMAEACRLRGLSRRFRRIVDGLVWPRPVVRVRGARSAASLAKLRGRVDAGIVRAAPGCAVQIVAAGGRPATLASEAAALAVSLAAAAGGLSALDVELEAVASSPWTSADADSLLSALAAASLPLGRLALLGPRAPEAPPRARRVGALGRPAPRRRPPGLRGPLRVLALPPSLVACPAGVAAIAGRRRG